MSLWPVSGPTLPPVISSHSRFMLGPELAAWATVAPASASSGTGNLAAFYPLYLPEPYLVRKLWTHNGSSVTGNVDIGLYDMDWQLIVSAGSTAHVGANVIQEFDIADLWLDRGRYYLAHAWEISTTGFMASTVGLAPLQRSSGAWRYAAGFPLPADASALVLNSTSNVNVVGIANRTLVA